MIKQEFEAYPAVEDVKEGPIDLIHEPFNRHLEHPDRLPSHIIRKRKPIHPLASRSRGGSGLPDDEAFSVDPRAPM